jgi:hypothetical protein
LERILKVLNTAGNGRNEGENSLEKSTPSGEKDGNLEPRYSKEDSYF